jgi:two-component sensor histidine kinase
MIVVLVQPVKSQDNHLDDLLNQYTKSKPDTARVNLLLKLSKFYLLKPGELAIDLDSALMLGEEAKLLSRNLKFKQGEEKADYMMGWIHVEAKNYSALTSQMKMLGDTNRIKVMLKLAEYKWGTQGNTKEIRDSAIYYSGRALEHAKALRSVMLEIQARFSLAEYTREKLEFESLKPLLIEGFKSCRKAGLTEDLSQTLLLALLTFGSDDQYYAEIKSIWKATLDDSKNAAETKCMQDATQELLEKSSIINFNSAKAYNFENADRFYFRLIDLFGKTAEQSPLVYGSLCYVYFMKGDLIQCLYNGTKAEKLAEKDNARSLHYLTYNLMGQAYFRTGNTDECINYLQKAIALYRSRHITPDGGVIKYLTRAYLVKNKSQEALALLDESTKTGKYVNEDLKDLLESKGIVYQSLGQYDKAEQYYLECLQLAGNMTADHRLVTYVALSRLYLQSKQYNKAGPWLDTLGTTESKSLEPLYIQEELALMRFRVDSAMGNYKNAIAHLQENRLLHDSIFTEAKNNQFEDLKIQYETDKKNKDIQIKTAALQKTTLLRNMFIAGAILLFILLAGIYYRYRKNQKMNRLLLTQQQQLKKLNEQQTKLLQEKDWLVKEIHHRVKNNLQIVMSLLNSQSVFIDNQPALTAIHDSQHRVHAMSLIHQKLYNSENFSFIDMSFYIRELASYLRDSFNTGQRIHFEFAVEPLEMDVSQAVPLGLILNEAITNSIKYAFPDDRSGIISISLSNTSPHQYLLIIADNGIGMPANFTGRKLGSLGMSLMEGLSEDLDGHFSIESNNGTTIKISFMKEMSVMRNNTLTTSLNSHN